MKKTALTLAFFLTLCSFTACGDTSSTDDASKSVSSSSTVESSEEETEAETTTAEESSEEETTEAEESEEETSADEAEESSDSDTAETSKSEQPAAENTDFTRGVVEDNVYTSEFAGLKFTAPDGWTFAKDDYILSMMNISLDVMGNNNEITKAMLDQVAIYDAVCLDQSTGRSIMIEYENLAKEVPDPDSFTTQDYLDAIDKQLSAISAISFSKKSEPETVTVAGQEFTRVVYTAEANGATIEQVYYVRREGKFMLGIIASSGTTTEDMTAYEKNFASLS